MSSENKQNLDVNQLMKLLSHMDQQQLQEGLAKASKILSSKDKDAILNEIKKNK